MAVDYDAGGSNQYNTNVSSFTDNSITVGTGVNRVLIYTLNFGWSVYSAPSSISVTWDPSGANQSLSLIDQANDPTNVTLVQLWGLVNPASGNKTISVSWASTVDEVKGTAVSFYGVDQTGGATTFNSTNTSSGISAFPAIPSITTSTNDAYIGNFICTDGGGHHFNGFNDDSGTIFINNRGLTAAAAGYGLNRSTTNMSVAGEGSGNGWAWAATNIKADILAHTDTTTAAPTLVTASFTGNFGSGSVVATGLQVGDKLIWLNSSMTGNSQLSAGGYFEIEVSVANQIQQLSNTDLSNWTFNAVFIRI